MDNVTYLSDIHKSYSLLKDEHIILSYNGILDGEMLDILVQLVDKKLTHANCQLKVKKKVVNILVEALQNTLHYLNLFDGDDYDEKIVESPFLIISQQEESYLIFSGNYVTMERADSLRKKIDEIGLLNEEELQEYYVRALNKEEIPVDGGAGLGLVDILRRAKRQVVFDLRESEENYFLFSLLVKVA